MNRAFVTEQDGWNYCVIRGRTCRDASLRGQCERESCKYPADEPQENAPQKTSQEAQQNSR